MSDDQTMYRTTEELEKEKVDDVVVSYPKTLTSLGFLKEEQVDELKKQIRDSVRDQMNKALEMPWRREVDEHGSLIQP